MSIRTERVARVIQRDIADILATEIEGLSHALVTVTRVRMSPDLSIAYVNLSILGGTSDEQTAVFRRINDTATRIRTLLASRIRHQVRAVPQLRFFLDESQAHAERIEKLLGQIRDERGEQASDAAPVQETELPESSTDMRDGA